MRYTPMSAAVRHIMIGTTVGLMLAALGTAEAATLNFSVEKAATLSTPTAGTLSASQTLSFDQFNPALGTLTGVTITYSSGDNGGPLSRAKVEFPFYSDGSATTSAVLGVTLGTGGTTLMQGLSFSVTAICNDTFSGFECQNTKQQAGFLTEIDPNPLTFSNPGDLAPFSGAGTVDLVATLAMSISSAFYGPGEPIISHYASWSGSLDVAYTYSEAVTDTPEPASVALLGTALGLAGLLNRRRRGASPADCHA